MLVASVVQLITLEIATGYINGFDGANCTYQLTLDSCDLRVQLIASVSRLCNIFARGRLFRAPFALQRPRFGLHILPDDLEDWRQLLVAGEPSHRAL